MTLTLDYYPARARIAEKPCTASVEGAVHGFSGSTVHLPVPWEGSIQKMSALGVLLQQTKDDT